MSTFFYIIIFTVEAITLKQYCSSIFIPKHTAWIEHISILGGYALLFALSFLEVPALNLFGFVLVNLLLIRALYQSKLLSAIFHTLILTAIMGLSELIVAEIFSQRIFDFYNPDYFAQNLLIMTIFGKQLYFLISVVLSRFFTATKENSQKGGKEIFALIAIPIMSLWILFTFGITMYTVALPEHINQMITISCVFLLMFNVIIWLIYAYTQDRNQELTKMQLQLQKESDSVFYYKLLLKQNEARSILIHDIKKHLNSIAVLNEQGKSEKISAYIKHLVNSSDLQRVARFCDNEFLNAILSRYQSECQELGIAFCVDIRSNTMNFISENDLTAIFCNLLDNAIEASSKLDSSFIELKVSQKPQANITLLTMVNSCRTNPFSSNGTRLISAKNNSTQHGFGLKSIECIVKKYKGNMELYYNEETKSFHTIITLKQN